MKMMFTILLLFLFCVQSKAYERGTIDTVFIYHWGTGQNTGQSPEYFPMNIFGKPDSNASKTAPASTPDEVCSLGLGGEIIIGFKGYEIIDGPGADFTIFENAFINPATNKVFAEPAVVSVSYDGINFFDFPFDTLTLKGCAGITPTNGKNDCFNPDVSGGDKFDLAAIGLGKARFIKIKDISEIVLNNPEHPYYDPIITGFDLDAVCGLHLNKIKTNVEPIKTNTEIIIRISNGTLNVLSERMSVNIELYNITGQCVASFNNRYRVSVNISLPGMYFLIIRRDNFIIIRRKIII